MTATVAVVVLAAMLAGGSAARAGEEAPRVSTPETGEHIVAPLATPDVSPAVERTTHSYGWQVVAADAAGILGTIGCMSAADSGICLVPYMIAAPAVHLSHGRPLHALGSVGVRLAFPIAGAMVAAQFVDCRGSSDLFCGLDALALGMLVGTVSASIFDALVLSTEERTVPTSPSRLSFLSPSVSAGRNGASFGLRGSF
jgi:hypothetical protein